MSEPLIKFDFEQAKRDVAAFGAKLAQYQSASGKVGSDILRKKGGDLVIALSSKSGKSGPGTLRGIMPVKGSIRSSNLSRMKAGGGIKISDGARRSVYMQRGIVYDIKRKRYVATARRGEAYKKGPRNVNVQQLLVKRELNRRESSRGYQAFGAYFGRVKKIMNMENQIILNRVGIRIADAFLREDRSASVLTIWGNVSKDLHAGLVSPRSREAVHHAFQAVTADIDVYLADKQAKALKKAGLN